MLIMQAADLVIAILKVVHLEGHGNPQGWSS
jgi:hypothetical protein